MLRKDIHMLGDSTMCFYTNDRKPRTGWGMKLQPLCHDDIRVRNYAMAGYSTRNFQNTGYFDLVLKSLRPHDHVIIQFGHNDKHPADFRPLAHTDLNEFTDNLSSWSCALLSGTVNFLLTNYKKLVPGFSDAAFQNIPVVSGIRTCTYCRDDIDRAKPPFRLRVVPDGADFPVVEESNGNLLHTEILLTN